MTDTARKPWRAAVIAAIVTFSVIAGTVGSWAYWSATGSATLGVGAATLSTTATGWTATTFANENITAAGSNSLTSTGSITITNTTNTTSTQSQTLNTTFSRASGNTTFANGTALTVWSVASAASCSAGPTGTTTTGTWGAGVTVSTTLALGGSIVYCMRNVVTDRQSAADSTGTATFTPQVSAQLVVGNFTGGAVATSTMSSQYIFPLASINSTVWYNVIRAGTSWCLDVSGSGTTAGSLLISYGCKNNTDLNQDFKFTDADGDTYFDIQPRHATNLRIAAASSTTTGSAVDMRTAATTTPVQEWQMQQVASGTYQFVNQYSGLCLSAPAVSASNVTQVTCNGGADQKFTLAPRLALTAFACTNVNGAGANGSVQYDWTGDYTTGTLTVKAKLSTNATYTPLGTTAGTSFAFAVPVGAPFTAAGTYDVSVLNAAGVEVAHDQIPITRGGSFLFGYYYYARC